MSDNLVNGQIVDSVADVITLTHGTAPSQAFAMLDTVMVETLGMAMYNAVSRQQGSSMIGSAAVTAACAKMLATPFGPAPVLPPLPPLPHVEPLPPVPSQPGDVIAAATAQAEDAIDTIRTMRDLSADTVEQADTELQTLARDATAPTPGPTPVPTPTPTPTPVATSSPHMMAFVHPVAPPPSAPVMAPAPLVTTGAAVMEPTPAPAGSPVAAASPQTSATTVTVTTTVPAPPCPPNEK